MAVLVKKERLDRVILDMDSRADGVLSLCNSIINEIDTGTTLSAQRIEQVMDNFVLHIDFFNRIAVRTDVVTEAKIQYDDNTYDASVEFPALVVLMEVVLDHILSTLGTDSYWSLFQYNSSYVKTYNLFAVGVAAVQTLKTELAAVRDFITVV